MNKNACSIIDLCACRSAQMGIKMGNETLPKDAVMLLSYINLKLRDYYNSWEDMCVDMGLDGKEIEEKLVGIDYHYNKENNQFV